MDSSENPGNLISVIESFIDKYYPGNKEFHCSPAPVVQHSFIFFPPGHRFRISNFIAEVKLKYEAIKTSKRKCKLPTPFPSERSSKSQSVSQNDNDTDSETGESSTSSISSQICASIVKWV